MKAASSLIACVILAISVAALDVVAAMNPAKTIPPRALQSPTAVVKAYVAAWNRHDPEGLNDLLDANSVHEDIPAGFKGTGPAEIKAFAGDIFKSQPDLTWRLTTIVEVGSTVAAEWTWTSTYTGDGPTGPVKRQRIAARGAAFAMVEGNRIRRFVDYYDFASAFPASAANVK